jgi:D-3-phosphoglycerate dehydrogenase
LIRAPVDLETKLSLKPVSFDEAISQADIVTVHVPLTPLTRGMFGLAEFARMKPGAMYVNTSRGGTYDLDALYGALESGHLRGAGLDVFDPEPPPGEHPLLQLPNVICTPHMASGTVDRHRAIAQGQFANFRRILRGELPHDLVLAED